MTLAEFFSENRKFTLAFSGGADSSYLLYAAAAAGCDVRPCFVRSQFQPEFEMLDAVKLCRMLGVQLAVCDVDVLCDADIVKNPPDRCYYCKRRMFEAIAENAAHSGYKLIIDGTNASDDASDRPGMRALSELSVRSPLRECGITKAEVRRLSRGAGLFTADKPAYACLATRIKTGENINAGMLLRIEAAESLLFERGYSELRVRVSQGAALVQLPEAQLSRAADEWDDIKHALSAYFENVSLDMTPRESNG